MRLGYEGIDKVYEQADKLIKDALDPSFYRRVTISGLTLYNRVRAGVVLSLTGIDLDEDGRRFSLELDPGFTSVFHRNCQYLWSVGREIGEVYTSGKKMERYLEIKD